MQYSIDSFGAVADGSLCTAEIQKAIDECFLAGGGEVIVPGGKYRTGGLRLRSGVTLHLMENAVLEGSVDPEDYNGFLNDEIEPIPKEKINKMVHTALPEAEGQSSAVPFSRWNNALIRGINAKNIAIVGEAKSMIDGKNCFDPIGEEGYRGPHPINFWFCENITLKGYTIKDGGNWGHAIQNSKNISISNVTVLGGHDGFDMRTCDNITVENCIFRTGDDCIAGFDNIGVTVRNCLFDTACSALRFGGTDVLIENCRGIAPSSYGFRGDLSIDKKRNRADTDESCRHNCLNAFLYYCDSRAKIRKTPGNIVIRNCDFKNSDAVFYQPYGHIWCCNRMLDSITFENCTFDGICKSTKIICPQNEPLTFIMKNCKIFARTKSENTVFMTAENFRDIILENVEIVGFSKLQIICKTPGNVIVNGGTDVEVIVISDCNESKPC